MSRFMNSAAPAWSSSGYVAELWNLAFLFLSFAVFWAAAFYGIAYSESLWGVGIPSSSKPSENCRYMKARNLLGILHAVVVSLLVLPVVWIAAGEQNSVLFASSEHLATCMQTELPDWNASGQAVAMAGLLFTAFLSADIVISWLHGLASWDYVVHHAAFITAGLIIRGHCILPYNAAILLAMEASTPFLNVMLLFRNRGPAYGILVQSSGVIFVMLFVLFRLVLNTYGAVLLWQHRRSAMPESVPEWQRWFLLGAIAAGSALQFFWFPAIAKIFYKAILNLLVPQSARATDISNSSVKNCSARSCRKEAVVNRAQASNSLENLSPACIEPDSANAHASQAGGLATRFLLVSSCTSLAGGCASSAIRCRCSCSNGSTSSFFTVTAGVQIAEASVR